MLNTFACTQQRGSNMASVVLAKTLSVSQPKTSLSRLQTIAPLTCRQPQIEKLQFMRISTPDHHLKNLGAVPKTDAQRVLRMFGYQRVVIGGADNRCWIRSPWFSVFHQYTKNNNLNELSARLHHLINTSTCDKVVQWRNSQPAAVQDAINELANGSGRTNHTINKDGYFSPTVEALIFHASAAIFHGRPESHLVENGQTFNALNLLEQGKPGFQSFACLILDSLEANTPFHSEYDSHDQQQLEVHWEGSDRVHQRQTDCMMFHRNTNTGHFEIMVQDPEFCANATHGFTLGKVPRDSSLSAERYRSFQKFMTRTFQNNSLSVYLKAAIYLAVSPFLIKHSKGKTLLEFMQAQIQLQSQLQQLSNYTRSVYTRSD